MTTIINKCRGEEIAFMFLMFKKNKKEKRKEKKNQVVLLK